MIKLYGIPNCNTVKKARDFLDNKNIAYEFHDFKKSGTERKKLEAWCRAFGWEKTVNRAGMTWRQLDDKIKTKINDISSAILLMEEKPSVIKRPIAEVDGKPVALGFKEEEYRAVFK